MLSPCPFLALRYSMKKTFCVLFAIIFCFLTACQPTPDNEVVVNKGDKKAENAVLNPSTEEIEPLVCPERWTETVKIHEAMSLVINAPVEVGEGNKHPVYTITRKEVDGDLLIQVMQEIFPDTVALRQEAISYDEILEDIQRYETILSEDDRYMVSLREKLAVTPVESTFLELKTENLLGDEDYFHGATQRQDGSLAFYSVSNEGAENSIWYHIGRECAIEKENWVMQVQQEERETIREIEVSISLEEAEKAAEALLQQMGQSDIQLSNAIRARCKNVGEVMSTGWALEYGRATEGTHGCYLRYSQNPLFSTGEEAYAMPWTPEYFEIYVTENGVESVAWANMYDIVGVANEDVQLLSFEEVQERVRTLFRQGLLWTKGRNTGNSEVYITKIILTTGIMQIADNLEEALLVPAWAIFYTTDGDMKDYSDQSLLLLNALDGSIMN